MTFNDESFSEPLDGTWRAHLRSFLDDLSNRAQETASNLVAVESTAAAGYFKPSTGIPQSDLAAVVQDRLNTVGITNVALVEWTGDATTVRPTTDPKVYVVWLKRNPLHTDPPRDSTHMLVGVDLLLRAVA